MKQSGYDASSPAESGEKRSCQRAEPRDSAADAVLALISAHDVVPKALLLHRSRCRASVARSRQLAMYLMHTSLGRTMTTVGRYFRRDRTTVAHACRCIEDRRDDMAFDALVSALEDQIGLVANETSSIQAGVGHVWH